VFGPCVAALARFDAQESLVLVESDGLQMHTLTFTIIIHVYWPSFHQHTPALTHKLDAEQSCVALIVHNNNMVDK